MTDLLSVVKDFGYTISDLHTQILKDGLKPTIEVTFKVASENKEEVKVSEFSRALEDKAHAISVQVLNHH